MDSSIRVDVKAVRFKSEVQGSKPALDSLVSSVSDIGLLLEIWKAIFFFNIFRVISICKCVLMKTKIFSTKSMFIVIIFGQ